MAVLITNQAGCLGVVDSHGYSCLLSSQARTSSLALRLRCLSRPSMHKLPQVISDPSGGAMFVADPKKPGEQG